MSSQLATVSYNIAAETLHSFPTFILKQSLQPSIITEHWITIKLDVTATDTQSSSYMLSMVTWEDSPFHSTSSVSHWAVFLGHRM